MYEPGIVIRRPLQEEVEELAGLILRFYRFNEEFDPAWSVIRNAEERAREVAKSYVEGKGFTLVATSGEKIVGYLHAVTREYPMLEKNLQAVITELYVLPTHRGKGIATKLVEEAIRELAKQGVTVVTSEFPTANFVAEKFYKSRGFRPYTSIYLKEV